MVVVVVGADVVVVGAWVVVVAGVVVGASVVTVALVVGVDWGGAVVSVGGGEVPVVTGGKVPVVTGGKVVEEGCAVETCRDVVVEEEPTGTEVCEVADCPSAAVESPRSSAGISAASMSPAK